MDQLVINPVTRATLERVTSSLPHALILHGKSGVGSGAIARHLAEQTGNVLDVIYPKKRQPNGSYDIDTENGTIIIDDIRTLYERTRSKFTSPQIVIIDFSGRSMSAGAQNAFLKLLEEPQQNVYFILAVQDLTQLLPTVVSRCQKIEIQPITKQQTDDLLATLNVTDPTKKARISFIANGLPAEIIKLATDDAHYDARIKTVQDARMILEGDSYSRLRIIQGYKDKRPVALQLLDDMIHQLQLSTMKSPNPATISQLDDLITAYERIKANGNIQLNLASVLL